MPGVGVGPVVIGITVGGETGSNVPGLGVILVETAVRGLGTGSGSNSRLLELDIVDSDVREGIEGYPCSVSLVSEPFELAAS